ncbi:MAG: hypothetical protein ACJA1I_000497 [Zhongshania marina]|jgi:hypothetical protein
MASSDWVTPFVNLVSGTDAKAEDINERLNAIVAAFAKLPVPRSDSFLGFSEPMSVGTPIEGYHAATKAYVIQVFAQLEASIAQDVADILASDPTILASATVVREVTEIEVSAGQAQVTVPEYTLGLDSKEFGYSYNGQEKFPSSYSEIDATTIEFDPPLSADGTLAAIRFLGAGS